MISADADKIHSELYLVSLTQLLLSVHKAETRNQQRNMQQQ